MIIPIKSMILFSFLLVLSISCSTNINDGASDDFEDKFANKTWELVGEAQWYKKYKAKDDDQIYKYEILFEKSQKIKEQYYKINDLKEGVEKQWYEDGSLRLTANFVNDKQEGNVLIYHPNGQLASKVFYEHGIKNGIGIYWHSNGQKAREGTYKNDELDGLGTFFNTKGEVQRKIKYENGKVIEEITN